MRGKWYLLLLLSFGCIEDTFPPGLYDYQVERLLSAGDSKVWSLTATIENGVLTNPTFCTDSTKLFIVATSQDSVNISELIPNIDCDAFDTLKFGNANASGDLIFTDSINFASGGFWTIQSITSTRLELLLASGKLEIYQF